MIYVTYLNYILFLILCGNLPLTSKTVGCWNLLTKINHTSADDHVPEAQKNNRTIKKRV